MLHNIQYKFKQHVSDKVKNNIKWAPNIRFIFEENYVQIAIAGSCCKKYYNE